MGLLGDYLNSEDGRMTLGLLAAAGPQTDPNKTGFGARVQDAIGSVDQWKQQQRQIAMQKQQQEYQQMLMADHAQKLIAEQRANEIARRKQEGYGQLWQGGSPAVQEASVQSIDSLLPAEFRTGVSGTLPATAAAPATKPTLDWRKGRELGYTPAELEAEAKLADLGKSEVKDWKEIEGPNGTKVLQGYDKFGQPVGGGQSGYVAPVEVRQGDRVTFAKPAPGVSLPVFQSPDSKASNQVAWARLNFDKTKEDANQDEAISPLAARMVAQQYLAGDSGALQNYGRGAQGARNLNAVRQEIARQANEAGMSGADIAAKMAEFGGMKAGQRTAGARSANIEIAANEAASLAPLAIEASAKVTRNGFLPFGKLGNIFDSNTNDPNMREFTMANNALVNAYGQVMSRGGVATVSDKEHAREILATAFDHKSYVAAVAQMQKEIDAARKAPWAVRKSISGDVSGNHESGNAAPIATKEYNPKTQKFEVIGQ